MHSEFQLITYILIGMLNKRQDSHQVIPMLSQNYQLMKVVKLNNRQMSNHRISHLINQKSRRNYLNKNKMYLKTKKRTLPMLTYLHYYKVLMLSRNRLKAILKANQSFLKHNNHHSHNHNLNPNYNLRINRSLISKISRVQQQTFGLLLLSQQINNRIKITQIRAVFNHRIYLNLIRFSIIL